MIYKNQTILGSYLAGLWEGDGSVAIGKKTGKPTIIITFHVNETPIAEKLLAFISKNCNNDDVGSIYIQHKRSACYLAIRSIEGLKYFITLVNGKLRTPKAYQLNYIINWLNQKHNTNLKKLTVSEQSISEDAWLAGFIDADGSFAVRQTLESKTTKKRQTECQFILVQRKIDPKTRMPYASILNDIASFLCVKLTLLKARNPRAQDQYKVKISSTKSKKILRAYLDRFPLLTSKLLNYIDWCAVDDLMIQKQHYTKQGIQEITRLKKSMNNSRIYYNWEHLYLFKSARGAV